MTIEHYLQLHPEFRYTVVCIGVYKKRQHDGSHTYKKDIISLNELSNCFDVALTNGCTARNDDWEQNKKIVQWYNANKDLWHRAVENYLHNGSHKNPYVSVDLVYAIETKWNRPCVDIDSLEVVDTEWCRDMCNCHPYVLSTTKQLPKFLFFKEDNKHMAPYNQKYGKEHQVELQGERNWAFVPTNQLVVNAELPLQPFDTDKLLQTYPASSTVKTPSHVTKVVARSPEGEVVDVEKMEKLLEIVATDGSMNEQKKWTEVAYILLHHFSEEKAFELFRDFSMTVDSHTSDGKFKMENWEVGGDDYNFFHRLVPNGSKTYRSLIYCAIKIDPEKVQQIFPSHSPISELYASYEEQGRGEEYLKMKMLYEKMVNTFCHSTVAYMFAASSQSKNYKYDAIEDTWYITHQNNTWFREKKVCNLNMDIGRCIKPFLDEDLALCSRDVQTGGENESVVSSSTSVPPRVKKLKSYIAQLGNNSFRRSVANDTASLLKHNDFGKCLDTNPHVLAFKNGLIDLKAESLETAFRPITPEDMISKTTRYDYDPNVPSNIVAEVVKFVDTLFIESDGELKEYVWDVLCMCVEGFSNDKSFYMCTGEGDNGKSCLQSLLANTFGSYYYPLRPSTLCQKDSTANETSEMPSTKGCKLMVASETSSQVTFNAILIKNVTGGDRLVYRQMYRETESWVNNAKLFVFCNSLSNCSQMDNAMIKRIRVIPFKKTFKHTLNETQENSPMYGLADPNVPFNCMSQKWCQAFVHILLTRYFSGVRNKRLVVPQQTIDENRLYVEDNEPVSAFMDLHYRKMTMAEIDIYADKNVRRSDKQHLGVELNTLLNFFSTTRPGERLTKMVFAKRLRSLGYEQRKNHTKQTVFLIVQHSEDQEDTPYLNSDTSTILPL